MPKKMMHALTALAVSGAKVGDDGKAFQLWDGGGLYLRVEASGKYWRFKYRFADKERRLALGVFPTVTLADARQKAHDARRLVSQGIDPASQKRELRRQQVAAASLTVEKVATDWLANVQVRRVSAAHVEDCRRRLERHVFPTLGSRSIADVQPIDILEALQPLVKAGKLETAKRVRVLLGQVWRYAIPTGKVTRDIAADICDALPTPRVTHRAAITNAEGFGKLLLAIDAYAGTYEVKAALRLAPMLFVRPLELRTMEWAALDLDAGQWDYVPAKGGRPMVFPLPRQAVEILRELECVTGRFRYSFEQKRGRPMSENTLRGALIRLGYGDTHSAHGFRATARTLLAEELEFPIEVIEMQLAHAVKDSNGRAYNRTTYLKQRAAMMQAWADYLATLKAAALKAA